MLSFEDFEKADGKVDWQAYRAAQVAQGYVCYKCGTLIWGRDRIPAKSRCRECRALNKPEKGRHSSLVRCPNCMYLFCPSEADQYDLYDDGDNEAWCERCEHRFTVTTHVSYTFVSPALIEEDVDGEEEEEEPEEAGEEEGSGDRAGAELVGVDSQQPKEAPPGSSSVREG